MDRKKLKEILFEKINKKPIPLTPEEIQQLEKEAKKYVKEHPKETKCPFANEGIHRTQTFNRKLRATSLSDDHLGDDERIS